MTTCQASYVYSLLTSSKRQSRITGLSGPTMNMTYVPGHMVVPSLRHHGRLASSLLKQFEPSAKMKYTQCIHGKYVYMYITLA